MTARVSFGEVVLAESVSQESELFDACLELLLDSLEPSAPLAGRTPPRFHALKGTLLRLGTTRAAIPTP